MPRVGTLPSREIIHLMIMKLGLIDLITVITGIVQRGNQEGFILTTMHDEFMLHERFVPVFISVYREGGWRTRHGLGVAMLGEPISRSQGKISSSNKLNEVIMLYLVPSGPGHAKNLHLMKYMLMPLSLKED